VAVVVVVVEAVVVVRDLPGVRYAGGKQPQPVPSLE
jgi:hypothetical protein